MAIKHFEYSTPAQKINYLREREQRIREATDVKALCLELADEMKAACFYSKKTYRNDIAFNLEKLIARLGLRNTGSGKKGTV